jgi:hypothetical protein
MRDPRAVMLAVACALVYALALVSTVPLSVAGVPVSSTGSVRTAGGGALVNDDDDFEPDQCAPFRCAAGGAATPKRGYKAVRNGCGTFGFSINSKWHNACCDTSDAASEQKGEEECTHADCKSTLDRRTLIRPAE